eukprot:scaffold530530_cov25-Prasinocladus_malaysianus.AAC.1
MELLLNYANVSEPTPPSYPDVNLEAGPWYHQTDEGYCSWECDGVPQGEQWCSNEAGNCMKCNGKWCPPSNDLPWEPATRDTY